MVQKMSKYKKHILVIGSVKQSGILPLSAASYLHHLSRPFMNSHGPWAVLFKSLSPSEAYERNGFVNGYESNLSCEKVEMFV